MKTVLLTGYAGFIGSQIYRDLLKKGYFVIGIDNFSEGSNVSNYSSEDKKLYELYAAVKEMREEKTATNKIITEIFNQLKTQFQSDWLLSLELYELALLNNYTIKSAILKRLEELKCNKSYTKLIENGLILCKN